MRTFLADFPLTSKQTDRSVDSMLLQVLLRIYRDPLMSVLQSDVKALDHAAAKYSALSAGRVLNYAYLVRVHQAVN